MEIAYRLVIYILMANVGYMIFSLFKKGYRHYFGYISQLFFLLCLMIMLVAKDVSGPFAIIISLGGMFLIILLPMLIQKKIDLLMAENRLAEIEPLARWKANLAWSELNLHLHKIASIAEEFFDDPQLLETEIRKLLNRGEPYDSMTRVFIGLIHFNNRNFEGLIRDLTIEGKSYDEYTFEELLYLIRAYLETTMFPQAIAAQIALEKKLKDPEDYSPEKRANLVISRMIFYSFLGWKDDLERLFRSNEEGIDRLPGAIKEFWRGVGYFNAGEFNEGEQIMGAAMRSCENNEHAEGWLPYMRKRFFGLIENKNFIADRLLPQLKRLELENSPILNEIIEQELLAVDVPQEKDLCTNILAWLTITISVAVMSATNIDDVVSLIEVGANSSFLVKNGEYFRLFTYQFIHIGWVHLIMNIVALKYFGPPVETVVGWPIFLAVYFFSGIIGGIAAVYTGQVLSAGASASVLGLLSAAIIFEFFGAPGASSLRRKNNFSTLIFILAINLIIGAVEKGVDNSAHLGGLFGGAIMGLLLIQVLRSKVLKQLVSVISIVSILALMAASIIQMFEMGNTKKYPEMVNSFSRIANASDSFSLMVPISWKIAGEASSPRELNAIGPFRERMTALMVLNDSTEKELLEQYLELRTTEIEKSIDVSLKVRKGPDLIASQTRNIYEIKWLLYSNGGPISVVDYLIFKDQMLFLVRFFLGTEHADAYKYLMRTVVNSLKSPFLE
ncbi:MAG: hypothetical protein Kow0029_16750 [Candidatus Rifleibacteriota bacterium]